MRFVLCAKLPTVSPRLSSERKAATSYSNKFKNLANSSKIMKLIAQGAEAKLYKDGERLVKERICKSYRHEEIDAKIRKQSTRREKRLLEKASNIINVPKVIDYNEAEYKVVAVRIRKSKGKFKKELINHQ